ncbi:hypothetical protein KSP40_PGU010065 [Platanthera guangdongensis]|uniref:Uncharacterized protein n=1 Tax=Platanthera guangdongensis TaxID=2320717 RepID=A0ABR2MQP1_9ASPA
MLTIGLKSTLQFFAKRKNYKEGSPPANSERAEVRIDPWKLIKMSKEKAKLAAEKKREILRGQKPSTTPLKPLPL